jgi:dTDP-4-dehydrorhamnose 3,5-epimerase-like enzyme
MGLRDDRLMAVRIPPGVMHEFYFHEATTCIYEVGSYYETDDELERRWNDPQLGIE